MFRPIRGMGTMNPTPMDLSYDKSSGAWSNQNFMNRRSLTPQELLAPYKINSSVNFSDDGKVKHLISIIMYVKSSID